MLAKLRALFRRQHTSDDMDEELRYHLDREIERNVASGMPRDTAELAARRAFGNATYHKEQMRDAVGVRWIEQTMQDVRFALRSFQRSPTFAVTVVLTIALALGLNTTAFTVFNTYVLQPIAVRDPYTLFMLNYSDAAGRSHWLTREQFEALRETRPDAESFAVRVNFARIDRHPAFGMLATGNAFQVMGVRPYIGRGLLPEDTRGDGAAVMVLSYDTWRSWFGTDSSVIGRVLRVRGIPLTVVGVTSPEFRGIGAVPPDYWAPLPLAPALENTRGPSMALGVRAIIRLRPHENQEQATTVLGAWAQRITEQRPDSERARAVQLTSVATLLPQDEETKLMFVPIFVAFGLVMLIACANVANMMLARALARQREIGIRLALGAERRRLIRQLLTESVLLALPAAVFGFLISRWTIDAGVRGMFATLPSEFAAYIHMVPIVPDARVFAFILAASLLAAVLFGLAPALQATRPNIVQASRGDFDTAYRPGRLRSTLLVAQITVCALLLIVTGLLLRGARHARRIETGMATSHVVALYPNDRSRKQILATLAREPMVTDVAAGMWAPLDGQYPTLPMRYGDNHVDQVAYDFVTANYFSVLGVRVLHGRPFTADEERERLPVAIVSEATANRLWPGRNPIGQTLRIEADVSGAHLLSHAQETRVVGVTANTVTGWIGTGMERSVAYFPVPVDEAELKLVARVTGDAILAREQLDRDMEGAVSNAPLEEIHTLDDYLDVQRYPFDAFSWVSSAVGVIALLLTVAGIYGVLSYLVAQRTREIGIRMALGAGAWRVVSSVLRETSLLGAAGVALGTLLALGVSRVMSHVLWIVDTYDIVGYGVGIVVVFVAAVAASLAPARRAARVNPLDALRQD